MPTVDYSLVKKLHAQFSGAAPVNDANIEIFPMPFHLAEEDLRREMWTETGNLLLRQGAVAAFTLAGGQGSRLGFDGPKGAFDFGLPSHATLFRLQARRLMNLGAKAGKPIPWLIMTSPQNRQATVAHFEDHSFFGYNRDYIRFFDQGMLPALKPDGSPLLDENGEAVIAPDGNGGCFRALASSGSLAWIVEKKVRFVFLCNIDNALVKMCDPTFVGALASNGRALCAAKLVHKNGPNEKVGIFAYRDSKPAVIEYSDLPESLRDKTLPDGSLEYDGGNTGMYVFRTDALRQIANKDLPWHVARKRIAGTDNCWKFEQFLFDAFPLIGNLLPYGIERSDEFAPVKNATGNDSPESARKMLGSLHRYYLERAKVTVKPEMLYEISPRLTYAGENLSQEVFDRELGRGIFEFKV